MNIRFFGFYICFFGQFWQSMTRLWSSQQAAARSASVSKYSRFFIVLYQEIAQSFAPSAFWQF
jgi:hypothetical protein